jgi:hypothetical protein
LIPKEDVGNLVFTAAFLRRTRSAPLRSPLSRQPLGVSIVKRRLLMTLLMLAFAAGGAAKVFGDITIEDANRMKNVKELFKRSDAVAVIWMTAAIPEAIGGPWLIVRARVNWAFKGVLNNEFIYFRCWEGCLLGERYIVFLTKTGNTLGQLERSERAAPVAPFPKDADYFRPAATEGYPFPVVFEPRLGRQEVVVAFEKAKAGLPTSIQQGTLECVVQRRLNWWADYEQLKAYLVGLAIANDGEHP